MMTDIIPILDYDHSTYLKLKVTIDPLGKIMMWKLDEHGVPVWSMPLPESFDGMGAVSLAGHLIKHWPPDQSDILDNYHTALASAVSIYDPERSHPEEIRFEIIRTVTWRHYDDLIRRTQAVIELQNRVEWQTNASDSDPLIRLVLPSNQKQLAEARARLEVKRERIRYFEEDGHSFDPVDGENDDWQPPLADKKHDFAKDDCHTPRPDAGRTVPPDRGLTGNV